MMFCRYYQQSIERELDNVGTIRRLTLLEHLAKCPTCRRFYEELSDLGEQLENAPAGQLSEGQLKQFESAVFARLSDESLSQVALGGYRQVARTRHWRTISAAAAVAVIVLAGLWAQIIHRQPLQQDPLAAFGDQSEQIRQQIPLMTCIVEQSMQGEIHKLTSDAKNAINFLKSCAPAATADLIALSDKNPSQNTGQ